jgi:hypothetical protein
MEWNHQNRQNFQTEFRSALLNTHRSYQELQIFLADHLGASLPEIVEPTNLKTVAFELINWAESKGRLDELYTAFCRTNSHHSFTNWVNQNPATETIEPIPSQASNSQAVQNPGNRPADPYVSHRAIEGVCQAALTNDGALLRIKAPHKMGKTELLSRLKQFAEDQNYDPVMINLRAIDAQHLEGLDQFWRWLCQTIADDLEIDTPLDQYWDAERGSNASCTAYLTKAVLPKVDRALVLMLDNVDGLFEHEAIARECFKLFRAWFEDARHRQSWRKLRQVLTYATEPLTVLNFADANHSPFNVGKAIDLPGFNSEQIHELITNFGFQFSASEINQLTELLGGHPELWRLALETLEAGQDSIESFCHAALRPMGIYSGHLMELETLLDRCQQREIMGEIARSSEALKIDLRSTEKKNSAYTLYRLGLIDWLDDHERVVPRCGLYRQYFRRVL